MRQQSPLDAAFFRRHALGVGSGLTYTGSLANLLWRRTLMRHGGTASGRDFHRLSALVTLPALTAGVVVLWAWAPLLR
jgi:arsenical pump membrane protein